MNKRLTIGVIFSAIIGIVSGLWTARKTGHDNRLTLKNQAHTWKERLFALGGKRK